MVLQDDAVGHRTVGLGEGVGFVLDAEHGEVVCAGVLQRALTVGRDADDGALADGEDITVDLILALALEDDVQLLVGLVGVQETAVLTVVVTLQDYRERHHIVDGCKTACPACGRFPDSFTEG